MSGQGGDIEISDGLVNGESRLWQPVDRSDAAAHTHRSRFQYTPKIRQRAPRRVRLFEPSLSLFPAHRQLKDAAEIEPEGKEGK